MKALSAVLIVLMLMGCSPPIIADLEQDKVVVQGSGLGSGVPAEVQQKAHEGCSMHGKRASQALNRRCLDGTCITALYLFACR